MDFLNSLHNALRSAFESQGAPADWSKKKTESLYKALDPEQQKLVRDLAKAAAENSQRAEQLEAVVSQLSSSLARVSSNDSAHLAEKDAEIQELRKELARITSLAQASGVTEEQKTKPSSLPKTAIVVAARRDIVKTPQGKMVEELTREIVMIREFVQSVRADATLLDTLRRQLKMGKPLDEAEKSMVRKTVVANIENWLIEKKRPSTVPVDTWKKLVRDSIADPQNKSLYQFNLPNLNHFIEEQVMKVRDLLFQRIK